LQQTFTSLACPALVEDLVDARAALTPRRTDASKARLYCVAFTNALSNNLSTKERGVSYGVCRQILMKRQLERYVNLIRIDYLMHFCDHKLIK